MLEWVRRVNVVVDMYVTAQVHRARFATVDASSVSPRSGLDHLQLVSTFVSL